MPAVYSRYEPQDQPRSLTTLMSDKLLATRVRSRLKSDDLVDSRHIDVEVRHGIVRLTGQADHESSSRMAADLIRSMEGVVRVENRIQIQH